MKYIQVLCRHWQTIWSWECLPLIWWLSLQPYFVAETTMPGKSGFDFNGASRSFNVLAEYHFGKVVIYFRIEPHSYILKFYWVAFDCCPFLFSPSILREEKSYRCELFCSDGRIQLRRRWRWLHLFSQVRINLMGLKWTWQLLC